MPVPVALLEPVVLHVMTTTPVLLEDGIDDGACIPYWLLAASARPENLDALAKGDLYRGRGLGLQTHGWHARSWLHSSFAFGLRLGVRRADRGRQTAANKRELVERAYGVLVHGVFSLGTPDDVGVSLDADEAAN